MTLAERRAKELDEKANKKKKTKGDQPTKIQKTAKPRQESDGDMPVKHAPGDGSDTKKLEKKQQTINKPVDLKPNEKLRSEQTDKQHQQQRKSSADYSSPTTPTRSPKKIAIKVCCVYIGCDMLPLGGEFVAG